MLENHVGGSSVYSERNISAHEQKMQLGKQQQDGRQAEIELEQSVRARPSTGGKSKSAPGLNSDQNKQHHRETEGNRETKSSDHLEQATGLAGAGTEQRMVDLGNDT
jgi:hypothetical protein